MPKEGLLFNDFGSIQKACRIYGRLFGYSWKLLKYVEDGAKIKFVVVIDTRVTFFSLF